MRFIKYFFTIIFFSFFSLNATELKNVSLQLQWKHQFQFAGYYVAKEKGFYKDSGFNVNIKEFEFGMNVPNEIATKKSTYGVGRPTIMISKSHGANITLLASIFQSSPNIWLAIKDRGISSLNDFKNKKVMVTGDAKEDATVMSMVFSKGLNLSDLNVIEHSFDINDLISGKTDLMSSYISNEPFLLKQKGLESVIFDPKDYGFDFYNDILFTNEDEITKNEDDVRKFTEASIKGWEYAFNNIEETVDLILKKYNTQNKSKEALIYEANELKKLAYYKTDKLGKIEKKKIEKIFDYYKLMGFAKNDINYDNFVFDYENKNSLTKDEINYLKEKKKITMCIDPSWMPFEAIDEKGNHIGMVTDYFKIFEENLNTKFEVIKTDSWTQSIEFAKARKCDIFSLAMETPERKKYMNFTTAYLSIPLVVATGMEVPFINDVKELYGKSVASPKGYSSLEYFKKEHPLINIVEVNNTKEGLDLLQDKKIYAFIGTIASIGYESQINYIANIKIAGKLYDDWKLGIGVRNDDLTLLNILNKTVLTLTEEQKREILNKWVSIKYESHIDYTLLWKIVISFLIILFVLLYFFNKEKKLKIKLEKAYDELKHLAITDKLTNVYNRHKLDEVLEIEKKRADRYNSIFGIMILDIDYFKKINDLYGHHVGDNVLKEFATILKDNSRDTDIIGRWGGEEFLIIVPETNKESIELFAQNIRKRVEFNSFELVEHLTVSIGTTIYKKNESTETTINRADNALYEAKNSGRNCVCSK